MARHVSAYLSAIGCIKIAALSYTVVTRVDAFSYFHNLILKSEACVFSFYAQHVLQTGILFCVDAYVSFGYAVCICYDCV
jgi:hypothetical protein